MQIEATSLVNEEHAIYEGDTLEVEDKATGSEIKQKQSPSTMGTSSGERSNHGKSESASSPHDGEKKDKEVTVKSASASPTSVPVASRSVPSSSNKRKGSPPRGVPSQPLPKRGIYYSAALDRPNEKQDDDNDEDDGITNEKLDDEDDDERSSIGEPSDQQLPNKEEAAEPPSNGQHGAKHVPSSETARLLMIKYSRGKDLPRSQYRGVSWDRRMDMWRVKVNAVHIGFFKDEKEAALAYDKAKVSVYKGNGPLELNFPEQVDAKDIPYPDVEVKRALVKTDPMAFELIERERTLEGDNSGKAPRPSRYRGVMWDIGTKSWRAKIKVKARTWYLGVFEDEVEAARAYDAAAAFIGRDKTTLNFPDTDFSKTQLSRPAPQWVMTYLEEFGSKHQENNNVQAGAVIERPEQSTTGMQPHQKQQMRRNKNGSIKAESPEKELKPSVTAETVHVNSSIKGAKQQLNESDTILVYDQTPSLSHEGSESSIARSTSEESMPMKAITSTSSSVNAVASRSVPSAMTTTSIVSNSRPASTSNNNVHHSSRSKSAAQGGASFSFDDAFHRPLRMRGVTQEADNGPYFARIDYFRHSLYLGQYPTAEEACLAHDIACIRLMGTHACREHDLLNCRLSHISALSRLQVPKPLAMLSCALHQAIPAPNTESTSGEGGTRALNARFRVNETKERLQDVREQYKRRRTSWAKPERSALSKNDDDGDEDSSKENDDDDEDDDEYEVEQKEANSYDHLVGQVNAIEDNIRRLYSSRSSSTGDNKELGKIPILELAKRVVLEAAKNKLF